MANLKKQNLKINFKEGAEDIVNNFIKKYVIIGEPLIKKTKGLTKEELNKRVSKIFKIMESQDKIFETIIEINQGKISAQNFAASLQKKLGIPQEKAKNLAKELEEKVLILAQNSLQKTQIRKKPITISQKPINRTTKKSIPKKKDAYRESAE